MHNRELRKQHSEYNLKKAYSRGGRSYKNEALLVQKSSTTSYQHEKPSSLHKERNIS